MTKIYFQIFKKMKKDLLENLKYFNNINKTFISCSVYCFDVLELKIKYRPDDAFTNKCNHTANIG